MIFFIYNIRRTTSPGADRGIGSPQLIHTILVLTLSYHVFLTTVAFRNTYPKQPYTTHMPYTPSLGSNGPYSQVLGIHFTPRVAPTTVRKRHNNGAPKGRTSVCLDNYISQLFGKEDIHSKDKMTLMGTNFARLSLKTRSQLRGAVANLPLDIQSSILESKAMFGSFDLWFTCFKKLVTAFIPDPDELDEGDNVFIQLEWEEHFGSTLRVYEKKHPFPGLLINYDDSPFIIDGPFVDSPDDDNTDPDPNWLSHMFEYGFIRFLKLTSHHQASLLPQIIQDAIKRFPSSSVTIRCWSTLPKWERDNWMNVQPSKHLVLINGHTHQGPWFEGNSHLSFNDPNALAECWSNYFNNQIIEVAQSLWKNYHFIGSTDRISIFGPRPYVDTIARMRITNHCNPRSLLIPGKRPEFEPILYCGYCSRYAIYHDHPCYSPQGPFDPFDGYPSDAPSTD